MGEGERVSAETFVLSPSGKLQQGNNRLTAPTTVGAVLMRGAPWYRQTQSETSFAS